MYLNNAKLQKEIKRILERYYLKGWFQKRMPDYLKKYLLVRTYNYDFKSQKLEVLWD